MPWYIVKREMSIPVKYAANKNKNKKQNNMICSLLNYSYSEKAKIKTILLHTVKFTHDYLSENV